MRKYGKKEKPLTIREPSLETRNLVDLFPFFADYEALVWVGWAHVWPRQATLFSVGWDMTDVAGNPYS